MGKKDAPREAADVAAQASREGIAELRRQFDLSRRDVRQAQARARRDLQPFRGAGAAGIRRFERAGTIGGLGQNLEAIFQSGALDPLVEERTQAARDQLAAAGLSRSGTALEEIGRIPTVLGFQIEQLLTGRSQDLANIGLGAATGQANVAQGAGQTLAGLGQSFGQSVLGAQQQIGQTQASGILGSAQAQTAGLQSGLGLLGLALSDPRLKENAVKVGEINDLGIYQWDWKPELKGMAVYDTPTLGFMADEVEEKYPEYVSEFGGFRCIAYAPLIELMEHKVSEYYGQAA